MPEPGRARFDRSMLAVEKERSRLIGVGRDRCGRTADLVKPRGARPGLVHGGSFLFSDSRESQNLLGLSLRLHDLAFKGRPQISLGDRPPFTSESSSDRAFGGGSSYERPDQAYRRSNDAVPSSPQPLAFRHLGRPTRDGFSNPAIPLVFDHFRARSRRHSPHRVRGRNTDIPDNSVRSLWFSAKRSL